MKKSVLHGTIVGCASPAGPLHPAFEPREEWDTSSVLFAAGFDPPTPQALLASAQDLVKCGFIPEFVAGFVSRGSVPEVARTQPPQHSEDRELQPGTTLRSIVPAGKFQIGILRLRTRQNRPDGGAARRWGTWRAGHARIGGSPGGDGVRWPVRSPDVCDR